MNSGIPIDVINKVIFNLEKKNHYNKIWF